MIENKLSRRITLFKRRRGLLKKAFEVANICDQYVYVALYDKEYNTMTQFSTHKEFPLEAVVQHFIETSNKNTGTGKNGPKVHYRSKTKKMKTITPQQLMHSFYKEDDNEEMEHENEQQLDKKAMSREKDNQDSDGSDSAGDNP